MTSLPTEPKPPTMPAYRARRVRRLQTGNGVRPVRIVHPLDGIEQEVPPDLVLAAGHGLWERWHSDPGFRPHDVIVGLDAGGILPALAVALASGTPYRLAWKLDLDLPDKHVFREPDARRTEVFTYGRLAEQRVLIVDDEVTSGETALNLVATLRRSGARVVGVACLVEDTSRPGRDLLASHGIPLCALVTL